MLGNAAGPESVEGPRPTRWTAVVGIAAFTSTLVLAALVSLPSRAYAVDPVTPVALGTAGTYSALGRTNVVNSLGPTTLSGDVGVTAGDSLVDGTIAGFGSDMATVGGATHVNDAAAIQAQADLLIAYDDARGRPPTGSFAGDQNGKTFTSGVYFTAAAFALTGTLTLDGENNPNSVFIFQVDAALNTAADSTMILVNGAQASHVFWQANGAAGTGAKSTFVGTILALGAITVGNLGVLKGAALSRGVVTLSANTVTTALAAAAVAPSITTSSLPAATVGTPYSATVTATGTGPITFTVSSGALPDGLVLDSSTGVVSGTPTSAGSATFTLTATNSAGTDSQDYTVAVAAITKTAAAAPVLPSTGFDVLPWGVGGALTLLVGVVLLVLAAKYRRSDAA